MASKFMERYVLFCKRVDNLEKSITSDQNADFVLEATARNYSLAFDLAWKVIRDVLVKRLGVQNYELNSPFANLQAAHTNGLVTDGVWLQMLEVRNQIAHDYDGILTATAFDKIVSDYYEAFCRLKEVVAEYYIEDLKSVSSFV